MGVSSSAEGKGLKSRQGGEQLALGHPAPAVALTQQGREQSQDQGLRHADNRCWATRTSAVGCSPLLGHRHALRLPNPLAHRAIF